VSLRCGLLCGAADEVADAAALNLGGALDDGESVGV
jgi:hypothetical protein